MAFLKNANKKQ